jgi:hypothetical protein
LYGAAEFSRDTDLATAADAQNLHRLRVALDELLAERVAVPPFEEVYLEMGLAVHFRCRHPEAIGQRVDVMSKMRGVDSFSELWERRTTVMLETEPHDLLSLPDLVQAKKTQREKDWPMISRLLETDYFLHRDEPTAPRVEFWLMELRSASLLVEAAARFPSEAHQLSSQRPLLVKAISGNTEAVATELREEQAAEQAADRLYWQPLKKELERLRHMR